MAYTQPPSVLTISMYAQLVALVLPDVLEASLTTPSPWALKTGPRRSQATTTKSSFRRPALTA